MDTWFPSFLFFFCQKKKGERSYVRPPCYSSRKRYWPLIPAWNPARPIYPPICSFYPAYRMCFCFCWLSPPSIQSKGFSPSLFPAAKRKKEEDVSLPFPSLSWIPPSLPLSLFLCHSESNGPLFLFLFRREKEKVAVFGTFSFPPTTFVSPYSSNVQRAFYSAPTFFLFFLENREILHPPYFRSKKAPFSFKIVRYKKVSLFHNPLDVGIITLFPPGYICTVHNSVSHIFF